MILLKFRLDDVVDLCFGRGCVACVHVSEFVDALSAPIQFLSQAEMRAKQLEGLGIDENDISDVSVPIREKQEPLSVADRPQSPTVTNKQSAPQSTGAVIQQAASDRDKKGEA